MHVGVLIAGDDIAERRRAANEIGDAGGVRIGRDHRQIGRAESQIDQHDIGVFRQGAGQRNRGISRADIAHRADHGDAASGVARLPKLRAICSIVLTGKGMPAKGLAARVATGASGGDAMRGIEGGTIAGGANGVTP